MYKTASKNLNNGAGRDTGRSVPPYVPGTRAEVRKWWYRVVEHDRDNVIKKYGAKLPLWFAEELSRSTTADWLAYWDRRTGKPKRLNWQRVVPEYTEADIVVSKKRPRGYAAQYIGDANKRIKQREKKRR